jgi:hypothetical protein
MLTPETTAKLDQGLALLRAAQEAGEAPPPGEVSLRVIAKFSGLSRDTVSSMERVIKAKVAIALLERAGNDLPKEFRRILHEFLESPLKQPTPDNQP